MGPDCLSWHAWNYNHCMIYDFTSLNWPIKKTVALITISTSKIDIRDLSAGFKFTSRLRSDRLSSHSKKHVEFSITFCFHFQHWKHFQNTLIFLCWKEVLNHVTWKKGKNNNFYVYTVPYTYSRNRMQCTLFYSELISCFSLSHTRF